MKLRKLIITLTILFLPLNSVYAAIVNFTLMGGITYADTANEFTLSMGDTIYASGQLDDSLITDGEIYIDFSTLYNNMGIRVGNRLYTDELDILGGAHIYFVDGVFDGLDYAALDYSYDSWGYLGQIDSAGNALPDFTGNGIEGNWNASSFTMTAVPVPAALWLFISGLGLFGMLYKKKSVPVKAAIC